MKGIFCSYKDGEKFKEYIKNLPPVIPQESEGKYERKTDEEMSEKADTPS